MTRFVWRKGIDREVASSAGMRKLLADVADLIADETRRNAPKASGRYRDGIESELALDDRGLPLGRVNAHHWTSHYVEFGTSQRPPQAPMRRAVDSGVARRALNT